MLFMPSHVDSTASGVKGLLLGAIVLGGAFLRLYNLGALPFDGDNSFMALAAQGIAREGLPVMPNGKLYLRALPLLYLEAFSVKMFGWNEWSLRLPCAVTGILNIWLVYVLVSKVFGEKKTGLLAALFFALSPWAVIVARAPRMYEPLLTAILASWVLFYKWYYEEETRLLVPLLLAGGLAITMQKLAILPLTCLLVPFLLERVINRRMLIAWGCFGILFIFWALYEKALYSMLS